MRRAGFPFSRAGRYLLVPASLALALAGLASGTATAGTGAGRPLPLVVRTDHGLVRGLDQHGAREFLGIPYAAPPTGANAWRPPQPFPPWRGVRPATKPGHDCAQTGSLATGVPTTSTFENCLFLNVYTPPRAPGRPLPVMLWIHGGGFTGGAGRIYDGAVLAARHHVIVVTINYRLSAFGFLALPSLDAESPDHSSGNYGLMDQQAAMRWVQNNAFAFGGAPGDVTIFGESAGGASVCANMASPTAFGLFSRAIAESGCIFPTPAKQVAERQGTALAKRLGCTTAATAAACLRTKPVAAILKAEPSAGLSWGPVAAGGTLPLAPLSAFEAGQYQHVPLLQGTNHDEGRFFVGIEFDVLGHHPLTAAQYPQVVAAQFGAKAAKAILAQYPLTAFASPDLAFAKVLTDSEFSCPALLADILTQRSGTYAYEFSDPSPPNDFGIKFSFPLGAAHSTELQYVFGKVPLLDITPSFKPDQAALSAQMMRYWTHFAATGNPNGGTAPHWARFGGGTPQLQELIPKATAPESEAVFAGFHQCAFWATIEGPAAPR
ncbi:MAG TPA: carboxylesterase family protein [Streptosporangiaceae bacterium]|nr:carboxylesterase family protein [Streptosporangiaceae bacterium]